MGIILASNVNLVEEAQKSRGERRKEVRSRVLGSAKLMFGGFSKSIFDCVIVDRSQSGVRVQLGSTHILPNELTVEFSNGTRRLARLVWASCAEVGLEFDRGFG
jgi:DNA-directed RNA polymerase subunit E'/Rpb7